VAASRGRHHLWLTPPPAREDVPLLDGNINSWLERDDRLSLVRCLRRTPASGDGTARAFLSDRYRASTPSTY
jgi:hypothetical protein